MRRRSRTRRVLKWVGLAGCVAIVAAGIVSLWWTFGYVVHIGTAPQWGFRFTVVQIDSVCVRVHRMWAATPRMMGPTGRWFSTRSRSWRFIGDHPDELLHGSRVSLRKGTIIAFPLLSVLLVVGVPTAFLWYRDRRPPKGRCQTCGYDLTGNVSGTCPECGEVA